HGERNRQGDRLTAAEIATEDRVEIRLDRRLSRHERIDAGRGPQRMPDGARVALRIGEAEPREDVAVDDAASCGAQPRSLAGRDSCRATPNAPFDLQTGTGTAVTELVDDQELPLAPVAEVVLQDRARPLGVGARPGERVGRQRRELRRRDAAGKQDSKPSSENRPAETQHDASPTGHASDSSQLGTLRLWKS